MSLRSKVVIILLAIFLVYGMVNYGIQRLVILPSFVALEREEANKNLTRAVQALERNINHLATTTEDWSYWDEVYAFVADSNEDFVQKNLYFDVFKNLKINLLQFYDSRGKLVWGKIYDLASEQEIELAKFTPSALPPNHPLLAHGTLSNEVQGVLLTQHGPMLVASKPILTSERQGPIRGALIMGRFLDEAAIQALAEQAQVALRFSSLQGDIPAAQQTILDHLGADKPVYLVEGDQSSQIYKILPDVFRQPALLLQVELLRDITAKGSQVLHYALLSIAGAGALVLLVLLTLLQRTVLTPVMRLTQHAVAIGESEDLRARLALVRDDEIGTLADEFDRMTSRLAEARRRLVDQSYHAGIAEMASGVLHNIGNAITPVGVRLATLEEELRTAPVAEMEMAVSELAHADIPSDRRFDLVRFVELAGSELAALITGARAQVATITQQIGHVQQILTDQERFSRASRILEPVAVGDLVHEATTMLTPPMLAAMAVEVDPSVNRVGEVFATRVALKQVVTNLLVNAAESILDSSVKGGRLLVCAASEQSDGRSMAHLCFEDNGGGIPAENLTRLFERGFSTKGRGSGLGLHWSANTVTALGGRLYAESKGPGEGACLHLVLPLAREGGGNNRGTQDS
jgi:sensor domain CHASE-containing protein